MKRQVKQIVGLSVFAAACMALGMGLSRQWVAQAQQEKPVVLEAKGQTLMPPIAEVAEKLNPTVVAITNKSIVKTRARQGMPDDVFEWFFGPQDNAPRRGRSDEDEMRDTSYGSGVIVSADGEILTNRHVIENPRGGVVDKIEVKLADGRTFEAKVLGKDDQIDIALLKIEAKHLAYAELGDSDKARVGEWVVAIGNPLGLEHTVTQGIISAKGRSASAVGASNSPLERYIQTDAAINRGNSGGPLLNLRGQILGINTAMNPNGQNIGFAVPSNLIQDIINELRVGRRVARGYMGILMVALDEGFQEALGVKEGVVVSEVTPGKAAAKAGLRALDVITHVDGRKVTTQEDLASVVANRRAGETIKVDFVRERQAKSVQVTLGDRKDANDAVEEKEGGSPDPSVTPGKVDVKKTYGFEVEALTPALRRQEGLPDDLQGVIVTDVVVRSGASEKLREGWVITAVKGKPVTSIQTFKEEVNKAGGKALILQVEIVTRGTRVSRMVSIPPRKP